MKINVEFNSLNEMLGYCRTVGAYGGGELFIKKKPAESNNMPPKGDWIPKPDYDRLYQHFENVCKKVEEFENLKRTNKAIRAEVIRLENERRTEEEKKEEAIRADSILRLNLSQRPYNCLVSENILTITELLKRSPKDLLKIHNLGKLSLEEIKTAVKAYRKAQGK